MGRHLLAAVFAAMLAVAACSTAMSLTEYAESLESAAAEASSRFDEVNAVFNQPSVALQDVQAAIAKAVVISNDLHSDMQALRPPDELAELHMQLIEIHQDVLVAQEDWAISAAAAESVVAILESPETRAVLSANEAALDACSRIQETLDATAQRAAFQDLPWLPPQLKESIEVALGCPPATGADE